MAADANAPAALVFIKQSASRNLRLSFSTIATAYMCTFTYQSVAQNRYDRRKDLRPWGPKKVRNYLLKRVQTMTISKVPWRKPPIPKQVAVICTRLILPAVFPAVKKYGFQRGSERTICLCKCPSRTVKGGAWPTLLPVPIHVPPVQADNSYLLTKNNDNCCSNTRTGSQKCRHTIPTKRGCDP